jgi:hypothetical protein
MVIVFFSLWVSDLGFISSDQPLTSLFDTGQVDSRADRMLSLIGRQRTKYSKK